MMNRWPYMRLRPFMIIALLAALAFALAACSSGGTASPTRTSGAASATPGRTAAVTSAATSTTGAGATATTGSATPPASGMRLASAAFVDGGTIPVEYTCSGAQTSPPLTWTGVPSGTAAFALTVDDPDVFAAGFDHWVLFNLSPDTTQLPAGADLPPQAVPGKNGRGTQEYLGPCPPPGAPHHYRFHLYALDTPLNLPPGSSKADLLAATPGHILGEALLVGLFAR